MIAVEMTDAVVTCSDETVAKTVATTMPCHSLRGINGQVLIRFTVYLLTH